MKDNEAQANDDEIATQFPLGPQHLSDAARAPGGAAGGALDGTYPNPGLAASVAGDGLTETSDVLAVGAGHGLDVTADAVDVDETEFTNIADTSLASPNNSVYKTLLFSNGYLGFDQTAATYMLGTDIAAANSLMAASGAALPHQPPDFIYFDDADFTVGSKTQKLRVRAQVASNATAPAITFTVGLYPITVAGGADSIAFTYGTVVTSSTVAITTPSASTVTSAVNSDFTIPADGAYALGVVTSGTIANNSLVNVAAQLQTRNA